MKQKLIVTATILFMVLIVSTTFGALKVAADDNSDNGDNAFNGRCPKVPGQDWKYTLPKGSKIIINVRWTAINDEDSGLLGYWGLDHYTRMLTIYLKPDSTYVAFSRYVGVFVTPQGAISPQLGKPETETGFGTLLGCKIATFTATGLNSGTQLKGNLGVKNYGGTTADVLKQTYGNGQTGDPAGYFDWTTYYFTGGVGGYAEPKWGFTYTLDDTFESATATVWNNFFTVNSGDIVT
jgi:hypothetical protein